MGGGGEGLSAGWGSRPSRAGPALGEDRLWEGREAGAAMGTQDGEEKEESKGAKGGGKGHCPASVRHHQSPHLLYSFCFLQRTAFREAF